MAEEREPGEEERCGEVELAQWLKNTLYIWILL